MCRIQSGSWSGWRIGRIWDVDFLKYLKKLEKKKPVICCGDMNVAHPTEIGLAIPKTNVGKHGFTIEEREGFGTFLKKGFVDTFRHFEPGRGTLWTGGVTDVRVRGQRNVGLAGSDCFLVSRVVAAAG